MMSYMAQAAHRTARYACLAMSLCICEAGWTIPITYTDYAAFHAALPGTASTVDFDDLSPGTVIVDGATLGGITFHYDFGGVQMQVSDVYATTSPGNFLGTDDGDVLLDGDDFALSFAPTNAIGMFFISADPMFDGDITLSAALTSVDLSVLDSGTALDDGGVPYFLGLIDPVDSFTAASITTIGGGFFLYNVDDITTARAVEMAEPGTLGLLGAGLAGLLAGAGRRRHRGVRRRDRTPNHPHHRIRRQQQ